MSSLYRKVGGVSLPAMRHGRENALVLWVLQPPRVIGDNAPRDTCHRLLGLGLLNRYEAGHNDLEHLLTEPLARPIFPPPLTPIEEKKLAQAALAPLFAAWREEDRTLPHSVLSLEAFRLAKLAEDPAAMGEAAVGGGFWRLRTMHDARGALDRVQQTMTALDAAHIDPSPHLLRLGAECAARLGESAIRREMLDRAMVMSQNDDIRWAELWTEYAEMLAMDGNPAEAEKWLRRAVDVFQKHEAPRERAVTMGKIADILQQQGHLDEALRMQQESLTMVVRIGDMDSHAHVLFRVAQLRLDMGQTDPASLQEIIENLGQSFTMNSQIRRADGIAHVGLFFGQLLAQLGQKEAAVTVLEQSEAAFRLLKRAENARQVHTMIEAIRSSVESPDF